MRSLQEGVVGSLGAIGHERARAGIFERHEAFLASGGTRTADVCPRSDEELNLANIMVVSAMNAGTASTFPPFDCRKPN